jgi:hypothetical protein
MKVCIKQVVHATRPLLEGENYMSQAVYEERRSAKVSASMEPFVKMLLPLLKSYGLPDGQQEFDHSHNCIIGNPDGARLEYIYDVSEGNSYQSYETRQTLTSHQLVHATTGESLTLFIDIHDVEWASTTLELRFLGAAAEIEELKEAVQSVLAVCVW